MKRENSLKTFLSCFAYIVTITAMFAAITPKITLAQISSAKGDESGVALEENEEVVQALKELLASMKIKPFTYKAEDRRDPFEPFISQKVMQEVAETKTELLTGMRQFEPGQLTLVAIIFTENNPLAMVEDSSHKGYIVNRGTKIGKSGIISDILQNKVIIKQLSYSMSKAKKYNTVEMTLRKEGEK